MIELLDIEFYYTRNGIPALEGITADIPTGIYLLAGENGSGKTTLLHLISGLMMPSNGECKINGVSSISGNPRDMGKVFLLEEDAMFPAPTIKKFTELHSIFYPDFSATQFLDNLRAFGLSGDEMLKDMSLGNRKKSQLAYVLALGCPVLLLDEPTNALDIQSKDTLRSIIASSLRDDQTIIVATHNVQEFENLFDGVVMLNRSRLIYSGTSDMISERLAFRVMRFPDTESLYQEIQAGRVLSICEAEPDAPTKVDWRLLYAALHSPKRDVIISKLSNSSGPEKQFVKSLKSKSGN